MDIPAKYLRSLKFIVVADARTGEELALYLNHMLPDMHRELLKEARKQWEKLGITINCHGGGRLSVRDNLVIFYSKSLDFGRYEDDTVLKLAPEHPLFSGKSYRFITKSGADSPEEVINKI